ncbi:glutamine--fructose-6-phosphate aminotransferase [Candidatus Giovannonibacteria bacterium RIFCSPLOWO2_01_FULL_44_40]|uniref:Glutamine--fructose-6-phosphate aminotransferase [isomerizing] n=1 Tax=Candidatus Giovannonibacteria bacterium RIFCSPHIGHO2_01_FULL_45_23 TaxID=1798325 RepID=A0A1F5VF79_9BACT|nr:MAG: glutamine--fructose-6-phosphate aminotransferase [Candidatus Giovannonibacteria bacterium RIFCSPHIGHO2_01_FULL_45_23]OGF76478.1 MAG: glutamine--fructose-6-phosphate aminotransferase [Candidatus Giovannonibacteria bacterium RIFCSPHIGHO2_02_FULL_45_13]OGF79605.1 MAG: glutamine--fructose-6-phosphate aminotransferase [Candidatus Giovannonibacteria bacterium RIFCSPLOWO2_01_FULL_44_40]
MCGIVGYIGKRNALPIVIDGLRALEYRGYDSAGVALWDGAKIRFEKAAGRVSALESRLSRKSTLWNGKSAIAHTRWATHGKPSDRNAHPHADCQGGIFVVHNGIIENYAELREALIREGHSFLSETDTEVLAHLFERPFLSSGKIFLEDAVLEGLRHVDGTFGIAVISKHDPEKIVVARRGSPIILGVGDEEYLVASDASAIVGVTKNVVYLHDNEAAVLAPSQMQIFNLSKKAIQKSVDKIDWDISQAQKGGFDHFMQKEIFEGPSALENVFLGRLIDPPTGGGSAKLGGIVAVRDRLLRAKKIIISACGTSYYAGLVGKHYFEEFAKIPASVEYASEFRYSNPVIDSDTAAIFISQSGETADTLEALREAKKRGALALGIVNVVGSTIARESDAGVYNHAGPEIGVASTKAFVSQLGALALLALFLGRERGAVSDVLGQKLVRELKAMPAKMKRVLSGDAEIKKLAEKYLKYKNFLYLGRKYQFPVALEGALKLKEISYRHAEGYASGEMKHGPIALIDENFPTVALAPKDPVYEKILSNIQEIKARNGRVLAVATEGDAKIGKLADDVIFIPQTLEMLTPLLSVIPLQLFAYHTAVLLGLDVDKPRNLAKSVTVE